MYINVIIIIKIVTGTVDFPQLFFDFAACDCDPVGSVNYTCQKFGGQCHCKPGVTGRQCDRCQAEFYNFTMAGCSGRNTTCLMCKLM